MPNLGIAYILFTGLVYGMGMFLLTKSVEYIGLGIPFALSIALGSLSGSLFSVLISGDFYSLLNFRVLFSYLLFIVSIFLYSLSLNIRDKDKNKMWVRGLVLCLVSSILCASQGACLAYFSDYIKSNHMGFTAQLVPWSLIFISCSTVFIFSHYRESLKSVHNSEIKWRNIFVTATIMSILYSFSIIFYTVAITLTNNYSEEYLWIIFMGAIIVVSTICSYFKGEWKNCKLQANMMNLFAIFLLLISIILLTVNVV